MYGILVWWQAFERKTYVKLMERVQRQAMLCITGALKSTPTKALETILGIEPLDIYAQLAAGNLAQRLVASGNYKVTGTVPSGGTWPDQLTIWSPVPELMLKQLTRGMENTYTYTDGS